MATEGFEKHIYVDYRDLLKKTILDRINENDDLFLDRSPNDTNLNDDEFLAICELEREVIKEMDTPPKESE